MNGQYLDQKYINLMSPMLDSFKWKKDDLANCRCPLCGDSDTSKKKARGYLYLSKNRRYRFKCHNCSANWSAQEFIKHMSPSLYEEYRLEYLQELGTQKTSQKYQTDRSSPYVVPIATNNGQTDIPRELETLVPISSLPVFHSVYSYLKSERKIPKEELHRLYYTENLQSYVHLLRNKYGHTYLQDIDAKYPTDDRIIIPSIDRAGKLVSLATRATPGNTNTKLRYITVKLDEFAPKIFGLDVANFSQKMYCCEGQLDSLYLPNSVAVGGSSFSILQTLLPADLEIDVTYIHDNQPRNGEIVREVKKTVDSGASVVVWGENSHIKYGKDIGSMVEYGMTTDELLWEIQRRTFAGIQAQLEFGKWVKV